MGELWKAVEGFDGYIEVSDLGNIRNTKLGILYKQHTSNTKYLRVGIRHNGRPKKMLSVHRLVAQTFIENPHNKPTVNHKNGNCQDNRAVNLEWMTQKENNDHAYVNGFKNNDHLRVVDQRTIDYIKKNYKPYCTLNGATPMAKIFGLTVSQVHRIAKGICYK